ncbi:MAG: hypothetical protein ACRD0E_08285, partial [Acidimicrobiales bacterium]
MLAAISASLMGCGRSQPAFPLPGPAASPALNDVPAGVIVPVGQRAQGIAVDPVTGTVAVGTANPPAVILTDEAGRTRSSVALAGPASHIEGRGPGGGFLAAIES